MKTLDRREENSRYCKELFDHLFRSVPHHHSLVRLRDTPMFAMLFWGKVYGFNYEYINLDIVTFLLRHGPVTFHLRGVAVDTPWIGTYAE